MIHRKIAFLLIFFEFILNSGTEAQQQVIQLYKFPNNQITNVSSITKDNKSFTWIATQDGIFRFDSRNFLKLHVLDSQFNKLKWSAIRKVCYNKIKNELIIQSPEKGLAVLNTFSDTAFFESVELPLAINPVDIISIDPVHDRYLLTTTAGIYILDIQARSDNQHLVKITKALNVRPLLVRKLTNNQLVIIDQQKNLSVYSIDQNQALSSILNLSVDQELTGAGELFSVDAVGNYFFIGSSKGFIEISIENELIHTKYFLANQAVYYVDHSNNGNCWVAASSGLYRLSPGSSIARIKSNTTDPNDDWLETIYSIYQEEDGNYWLGTQNGLALVKDQPSPFYSITNTSGTSQSLNHVYHLGLRKNGPLLISSSNGLYRFEDNSIKSIKEDGTYFLNFSGPGGHHIVSGLSTTYVLQNNRLVDYTDVFPEFRQHKNLSFNDFEFYGDSIVFLSTENNLGVYKWNYKKKSVKEILFSNGYGIGQNNGLYRFGDQVFILTDSALLEYDIGKGTLRKRIIEYKNKTPHYGLLFDLVRLGNRYFIASYGDGILETDTNFRLLRVIDENSGLSNNGAYRMLPVGDTLLYISTNNGINRVQVHSGKIMKLFAEDGLHGNIFEEFSALQSKGNLYFGGKGGITILDPSKVFPYSNKTNLILLDFKIVDGDNSVRKISLPGRDEIVVPNSFAQVTLEFQNVVYPFSNHTRYEYRIPELNEAWINLDAQNFVTLISIRPGTYTLEVRAIQFDGIPGEIKELRLVFLPKWYQTWWFTVLVIATIIGIGYALYRFRIQQFKKEQGIRSQLASDLHDDLGSTMNSVKVYANLALMNRASDQYLLKVKESTQEAIIGIRDMIWVLDDSKDSLDHVVSRIKGFAAPLCEANDILYIQEVSDPVREFRLGQAEKRNLYMMMKEAINNAIKYSSGKKVEIEGYLENRKPVIKIKDDGRGFNPAKSSEGNGLKNLYRRAKEINYRIDIESAEGQGTIISLKKR